MKTLIVIFLFLILLVLVITKVEFTENDKKIIDKTKKIINSFTNTNKADTNIQEKNGIIQFLKTKFNYDDIMVPKNMVYDQKDNMIIFKNIKIIGINYQNEIERKNSHNIDLIFTKNNDNMFLSQHYLYGHNGTFTMKNLDNNNELDIIPDIIHLTTDVESDSELNTTESKDIIIPSLL